MNFFFHHVGGPGSERDLPKTVFSSIPISRIESAIPDSINEKREISDRLKKEFPLGSCNVWGVPAGATSVMQRLEVGDTMLLVGSIHWINCTIPAMGEVRVYPKTLLLDLSRELWGETRFPYIFFFKTERLDLTWLQFLEDIGYAQNFNPTGKVYRVTPSRFSKFDGPLGYTAHLRKTCQA